MHTQHLAVFPPGDDLHQALAPVQDQSLAVGHQRELAHLVVDALSLALLLGQTDRGSLRLHIHAGGVGLFVIHGRDPHDVLRSHFAHGAGGVGQLGLAEDTVADGVHAGHAGLHLVVDDDPAPVVGKAGSLQVQAGGIGLPADGHQHLLRLKADGLAGLVLADHLGAHGRGLHGLHRALQVELHAHLLHVLHADGSQVAVQHGQHVVQCLHHGDLGAEGRVGAGQLQADDAATDDHHALGQLFQAQGAGGVDAVGILLQTGDGRLGVDGAGGHDDGVGGHLLHGAVGLLHREGLGAGEAGLAVDLHHLVGLQQSRYATGQLFGDGVLVGDHLGEVHPDAVRLHADLRALVLDLGHQLCAVQQALGRDAANVQAGAAQVLPLHQGHPGAQLGRPDGGHIAAGAAADDQHRPRPVGGSRGLHSRGGRCRGCGGGPHLLAGPADVAQQALYRHVGALLGHDLQQDAVGFRRHLVGQLVGGNLQQGLTGLDGIALRLQPPLHGALLHGQPQLGHFDFRCHCLRSSQQDVHGMLQQIRTVISKNL